VGQAPSPVSEHKIEVDVATEQEWSQDRTQFVVPRAGSDDPADLAEAIGPLAGVFVQLAKVLSDESTVQGVLERVVHSAKQVVPGADLVSITVRSPGGYTTPVETDPLATRLDEAQYRLDEGPCVEATRTAGFGLTFCRDLRTGSEYPRFGRAAAAMGVHSVLAVGLFPHGGDAPRMGALNFYSYEAGGLDERDRDIALVLAAHAATALAATTACTAAELEAAQLRQAVNTRDVIGQAKGILMERRKVDADEAFDILRAASQSLNIKLAQVARTLVEHRAEI
jgi:ANTAR domain/GAF domain